MNHFIQSKALLQVMDLWTISSLNSEERNIRYYDPRLKLLLSQAWIQYTTQEKREEKKRKKGHPLFLSRFCGCPVLCSWRKKERKKERKNRKKEKRTHIFLIEILWVSYFDYRDFMGVLFWLSYFDCSVFMGSCFACCLAFMGVQFCFLWVFCFVSVLFSCFALFMGVQFSLPV